MRKLICAGALALACATSLLGGCAELQKVESAITVVTGNVVTPQAVYVAINAYDAAEATATNYIKLPRCSGAANLCRTPSATAAVKTWIRAGRADRKQLLAGLQANPSGNISLVAVYQDLQSITAQISALVH